MRAVPGGAAACVFVMLAGGCATRHPALFDPAWGRTLAAERARERAESGVDAPRPVAAGGWPVVELREGDDGALALSLEDAVALALQQNRELEVARYTPVVVGAFELIELGRFDPEVFAEGEFRREEQQETARSTGEQFGVRGDESLLLGGVRQTLPSGTLVELGVEQSRSISDRSPEQQRARLGLSVTQSLLRGFGPSVNMASVRQARLDTLASFFELRGFTELLLADTERAYWSYVLAGRTIEIFERSLEVARAQLGEVEERIAVGVLPPVEAAAARSEVALREQALIDARSELRRSRISLFRLIGVSPAEGARRALRPTSRPSVGVAFEGVEASVAAALALRPELNEARLRLERGRLEVIRTRNGLLPRLDVFIALGKSGYADTLADSFTELDGPTYDATAGFSFSQPVGRASARGAYRGALATRAQAAASVRNLEQLVELDVHLASAEVERALEQIGTSRVTRELQAQTLEAERERFAARASTALLVAQAQRDLLEAEIAEVESVISYRVALVELYLAEGTLLERRGVSISE